MSEESTRIPEGKTRIRIAPRLSCFATKETDIIPCDEYGRMPLPDPIVIEFGAEDTQRAILEVMRAIYKQREDIGEPIGVVVDAVTFFHLTGDPDFSRSVSMSEKGVGRIESVPVYAGSRKPPEVPAPGEFYVNKIIVFGGYYGAIETIRANEEKSRGRK